MAPFPETEIMTIKRLEVALRKMDYKLLKDGAYKLHEKFHSGHVFEYTDLLKELFSEISNNSSVPNDIKDILTPTIEDILSSQGIEFKTTTSPYDSLNQNRVSSLTSLSYNTQQQPQPQPQIQPIRTQEKKIDAFDAFSNAPKNNFKHSPYSAQPFSEFNNQQNIGQAPIVDNIQNTVQDIQNTSAPQDIQNIAKIQENTIEQTTQQTLKIDESVQTFENIPKPSFSAVEQPTAFEPPHFEMPTAVQAQEFSQPQRQKTYSLFYGESSSNEKVKNILKYRELISKSKEEHISINEILDLISEINTQSNTNVSELQSFINQLKPTLNKVNLITNSQSAHLINVLNHCEAQYKIYDENLEAGFNLMPVLGLVNLFKCSNCDEKFLDTIEDISPLVVQCPKCKKPMYPNYYTINDNNCEINIDYYNDAMVALSNSNVWVLIHPAIDEKFTYNLLLSALKTSNQVEEIFILDKDINVRENLKKDFHNINRNLIIHNQTNASEEFFNSIS